SRRSSSGSRARTPTRRAAATWASCTGTAGACARAARRLLRGQPKVAKAVTPRDAPRSATTTSPAAASYATKRVARSSSTARGRPATLATPRPAAPSVERESRTDPDGNAERASATGCSGDSLLEPGELLQLLRELERLRRCTAREIAIGVGTRQSG